MPSREEVEHLKENWADDPIWDIEETEGFEEHHDELLAFRQEKEAAWERAYRDRIEKQAEQMGLSFQKTEMYNHHHGAAETLAEHAKEYLIHYLRVEDSDGRAEVGELVDALIEATTHAVMARLVLEHFTAGGKGGHNGL